MTDVRPASLFSGLVITAASLLAAGCSPTPGDAGSSVSSAPAASAASAAPDSGAPAPSAASASPPASSQPPSDFTFDPPGAMQSGATGVTDATINVPGMRFPFDQPHGYADSQVWGHGGLSGPGGGQCDAANYSYPWHDNFCEPRQYKTALCPSGAGHQGQDIRPNACHAATYVAVAAESGTISQIGAYTVYLSSDTGRMYLYLHMQMNQLKVHLGDHVTRGQAMGLVSNNFGSTATTIHLHFEIKEPVTVNGTTVTTWVSPYSSLVDGYQRLLAGDP